MGKTLLCIYFPSISTCKHVSSSVISLCSAAMEVFVKSLSFFLLASSTVAAPAGVPIAVPGTSSASSAGLTAYVSLSIELSSFPLFAGMKDQADFEKAA